jgi:hypothetical protein
MMITMSAPQRMEVGSYLIVGGRMYVVVDVPDATTVWVRKLGRWEMARAWLGACVRSAWRWLWRLIP